MRFIRVFLSLYSIQLIVISALLITYLAVTTGNPTEVQQRGALATEREGVHAMIADLETRGGDDGTRTGTSRTVSMEEDLETWRSLKAAPNTGEIIGISDAKTPPEKSGT